MATVMEAPSTGGGGGFGAFMARVTRQSDVMMAVAMAVILGVMIVPLPEIILDLLIIVNIAAALMVLLVSMYTTHPLQFSSFPALLLMLTPALISRLVQYETNGILFIDVFNTFTLFVVTVTRKPFIERDWRNLITQLNALFSVSGASPQVAYYHSFHVFYLGPNAYIPSLFPQVRAYRTEAVL